MRYVPVRYRSPMAEPSHPNETPPGDTPAQETPVQETPAQETPAQETPAQEDLATGSPAGAGASSADPPPPVVTAERNWRFQRFFLIALLLGVGVVFVWTVRIFLQPILLATVFATLFFPLYEGILRRFGGRRVLASLTTCVVLVLGFLGPLYSVGHLVFLQARDMGQNFRQWWGELQQREGGLSAWLDTAAGWLENVPFVNQLDPRELVGQIDWGGLIQTVAQGSGQLVTAVLETTGRGAFQAVLLTFVTLFTLFYFFIDGRQLAKRARDLLPLDTPYKQAITDRFVSVSRALVKGTLAIAAIQGVVGGLTLWIFGVQAAALWGVLVAVLAIIPAIGPWLVLYPAAAVQLLTGHPWQALGIFLVTVVVILNLDNLLRPRLVGSGARMHDLLIFFSTLGGLATFGPMGFIVGPVVAALFLALLEIYDEEFRVELEAAAPPSTVRSGASGEDR